MKTYSALWATINVKDRRSISRMDIGFLVGLVVPGSTSLGFTRQVQSSSYKPHEAVRAPR